ncbi:glutamate ABC transporter substrate-binding protein [Streptomyces sp. G45]|uniref:glutamate ABC transporter substrate-binding protein n=1 Tax=Streptomyces sp. G45 TaxID=3406627 RepID=UPI003C28999A
MRVRQGGARPGGTGPRRGMAAVVRGWGGVASMALACLLAAALVLVLPRVTGGDDRGAGSGGGGADRVQAQAAPARAAEDCEEPERSLRPDDKDGPTIEAIKNREVKKLIVGVDQNSFGWGYRDPNKPKGALQGFDIDLAREIGRQILGKEDAVVFRAIPTNKRIPALENGDVDMVIRTMTVDCDRVEKVDFSTAYFATGQQILAPKSSRITGFNSTLQGKKVCSAEGSTAFKELKENSFGADISTTVPNQLDCLVRLQLGEVEAVVTDGALAASQAAQDPTVELKGGPLKPEPEYYAVAMKKGSTDLVRRVNAVLDDYRTRKEKGWKASYDEWLRKPLRGKSATPPEPKYRD